ncbi:MAG: hypothetical protein V3U39_04395 [Acidimicrobiia bacterium]|jgi:hypothetical protein
MEIPDEVARAQGVPDDLDSSVLGPFTVPSLTRRRRAGAFYLGGAALLALGIATGLPGGMWIVVGLLLVIGAYHFLAAFELGIREREALSIANRSTEFPVGHASAALGFVGWRSRPVWNVLVFSADEPPTERGLVRINAVNGEVEDVYVEGNPDLAGR